MREMFPGFYRPTESEFKLIWQEGVFVFDTNMLLNMYRYSPKTRETLFDYMARLEDRLWIPYQVAYEFQVRRLAVIHKMQSQYKELGEELDKYLKLLVDRLNGYKHHPYLSVELIQKKLDRQLKRLRSTIDAKEREHPDYGDDDPLRDRLDDILAGKIGKPYDIKLHEQKRREAQDRCSKQIPPGYKDFKKDKQSNNSASAESTNRESENGFGDVLIWFQMLDEAQIQRKPMVLITDDTKEDWWYRQRGQTIGPRPELVHEMQEIAAVQFYMYTGDRFIEEAAKYFNLPEQVDVVTEAREVREGEEAIELSPMPVDASLMQSLPTSNSMNQSVLSDVDRTIQQFNQRNSALLSGIDAGLLRNNAAVLAAAEMAKPSKEMLAMVAYVNQALGNMAIPNAQLSAALRAIADLPTPGAELLASASNAAIAKLLADLAGPASLASTVNSALRAVNASTQKSKESADTDSSDEFDEESSDEEAEDEDDKE